jgi:hypothetical protein
VEAERFVREHPDHAEALLFKTNASLTLLDCRSIARNMDDIRTKLSRINFDLIRTVRGAKYSTNTIFEQVFKDITEAIDSPLGILYHIDRIFTDELGNEEANTEVLKLASEVKLAIIEIRRLCWRLLHPAVYIITDIKIASGLFILSIVAIPLWYFFGYHQDSPSSSPPSALIQADVSEVIRRLNEPNQSLLARLLSATHYVFEATFLLPIIFFLPAAALGLIRQIVPVGRQGSIKTVEEGLYSIGAILQKRLPDPPKGPTVVIGGNVMTGDNYTHHGQGSQGPHSTTNVYMNAWNDTQGKVDLQSLSAELEKLRAALKAKPQTTAEEDEEIAAVGGAAKAAREKDGPGTLEKLSKAGNWALKVAKEIGVSVAAEMILKAIGAKP